MDQGEGLLFGVGCVAQRVLYNLSQQLHLLLFTFFENSFENFFYST